MMKKTNSNRFTYMMLSIVGIFLFISCKTSNPTGEFLSNKEFLTLNFRNNQKFEYLYYKLDTAGISYDYNEGFYAKYQDTLTLYPDTLKNRDFELELHKIFRDSVLLTRIKIETNISGDFLNKYRIYLNSDSVKIAFNGVSVDTIINASKFKNFRIEIFIAENYLIGTPAPKYKSILTKEINLDTNFNFFTINVPVKRQTFYYKNSKPILIKDLGTYWMLVDVRKKILKGKMFP